MKAPDVPKHPAHGMAQRAARASFWAISGGTSQYLITFLLLVYLARVLQPRDFGLMATVTIGLELGMQIARWGQIELLQQQRYRNDDARNQAMRISLGWSLLFAAGYALGAEPLARFYHAPELATMMYVCAPVFVLASVSATAEGILRGEFRFRMLAFRGTISALIGGGVAIALAADGYGAIALALQRIVQSVIAVVWVWSSISWRPSLKRSGAFSPALLRDGASVTTGTLLPLLVPRSIDLFVGIILGPVALGLMRIAFRVFEFVGQLAVVPLVGVAHAQMAQYANDRERLRDSYLRFTQASASLLCPLMIGFALVAPEVVPAVFGPNWSSSIPLVQMVSVLALTAPPNYFFPAAMVALGHSHAVLRQGIFQVVIGTALVAVAAQYSLEAVLASQILRGILLTAYNLADMRRYTGLTLRAVAHSMAPPYLASGAMAVVLIALRLTLSGAVPPTGLIVIMTIAGMATFISVIVLGGHLRVWPDFLPSLGRVLPGGLGRFLPG